MTQHGTLPGRISNVWTAKRAVLMPLPPAFDGFIDLSKRVLPTWLISFERNRYTVPASFADRPVRLRIYPDRPLVAAEDTILCAHSRIIVRSHTLPSRTVHDLRHYLAVLQRKQEPLRNGAPVTELSAAFRPLRDQMLRKPGGGQKMVETLALVLQHDEQAALTAAETALAEGVATKPYGLNLLQPLVDGKVMGGPPLDTPQALAVNPKPTSNAATACGLAPPEAIMRHDRANGAIVIMLRNPKMHGMAQAVTDLIEQAVPAFESAVPILSQLLKAELAEREVCSIAYHMKAARFLAYKDLSGVDFSASEIKEAAVRQLHRCELIGVAENVVLIGGPGIGKTHVAAAAGIQSAEHQRSGVRFFSITELVNALEQKKAKGKAGQMVDSLTGPGLIILDELGYLPCSGSSGALLFHLLSRLYERTSVVSTRNLSFSEWARVFGNANMTTALLDRLSHSCHIPETENGSFRFKASSTAAVRQKKSIAVTP